MQNILALLTGLGIVLLVGCGTLDSGAGNASEPPTTEGAATSLEGTSWLLTGIDAGVGLEAPAAGRGELRFSFAGGRVAGSAGCNQLGATYTQRGETLSVGPIQSTKMACQEPLMGQERNVGAILMAAERAILAGDTLTISTADGRQLVFAPTPA